MTTEPAAVVIWLIESDSTGSTTGSAVAKLVYENGQPFAELIEPNPAKPSHQPQRLPLLQENLRLIEEASAGRPAVYYHRGFLIRPQ
jgi:hypothetical protein